MCEARPEVVTDGFRRAPLSTAVVPKDPSRLTGQLSVQIRCVVGQLDDTTSDAVDDGDADGGANMRAGFAMGVLTELDPSPALRHSIWPEVS
jgi:hypothetical protein